MSDLDNIKTFFQEYEYGFTVFVVEQRFAVGRGAEYFRSFKGKDNLIDTNRGIKKVITKILKWIQKNIPDIAQIAEDVYTRPSLTLPELITSLSKLFTVEEHQAAGPDVLDPIIIQEGQILQRYLNQLIALHKNSILRPAIIVLLKDNDFDRAKSLLSGCPDGCYLKMIRNSGDSEIFRVINKGCSDVKSFLEAFTTQCFSTCSHTRHDVLLNKEWAGNSIIKTYSPTLLKIRTNLLYDEKEEISETLDSISIALAAEKPTNNNDAVIARSLECIAKLNQVYCRDHGGTLLSDALALAQSVDNELLTAHVYRFARLMDNISRDAATDLLQKAQDTFHKYHVEDHALYCWNNRLVSQFYTDNVDWRQFRAMKNEAAFNVPGLVGMSHLINNTGVAYLVNGEPDQAMDCFAEGLQRAQNDNRIVQKIAIRCNIMITKSYGYQHIDEIEFRQTLNLIMDGMKGRLPFISARYAMNVIAVAFRQNAALGKTLLAEYPIVKMINEGLLNNKMGSGQLVLQIATLSAKYPEFELPGYINPPNIENVTGVRRDFIARYGLNPFFFSTWL